MDNLFDDAVGVDEYHGPGVVVHARLPGDGHAASDEAALALATPALQEYETGRRREKWRGHRCGTCGGSMDKPAVAAASYHRAATIIAAPGKHP